MSVDRDTIAFYDREAATYSGHVAAHGRRPSLEAFEARLPRGAAVLDLGCGGGQDGAWLRDCGHHVVAMDASSCLADVARQTYGLDVRVATFADLDDAGAYDGVWSAAALHHAASAELPDIVARIARALKPGGAFAATMKAGADRRDALGRFYCAADRASVRALFDAARWTDVAIAQTEGAGYDDVPVPWLILSARRL